MERVTLPTLHLLVPNIVVTDALCTICYTWHTCTHVQAMIDELHASLRSVMDFKQRQMEVEDEMLRLQEENQELKGTCMHAW